MSSDAQNIINTNISDVASFSIHIIHRNKNYEINYIDFSNKSSYKEVIGLPHSFKIIIDDILETNSVNALIEHIKTRKTTEIINESNIFDLNFLSHLYGFYLLQSVTGPYLLSKIPVNLVFEAFERRKNVNGYVQSFSYYFTHNFDTFVHDPSFYTLPFNVIQQMLEFNVSELTVDDVVQFTINTYYVHGKKSLTLLEKANNCRSISEQKNQIQDAKQNEAIKKQNSKTNLRNIFYKMIDSEDDSSINSNQHSKTSTLNDINNSSSLFNLAKENEKSTNNNNDNFSVNSSIYSLTSNLKQTKKAKRGGKILERECSTSSLIRLYATICNERPYPYTQYILSILSKRKKVTATNVIKQEVEELRYNISSIYIALLETTQGNKNAAYILLTSLFESGKIDFMTNKDIINLYKNLSNIPPPQEQHQQQIPSSEKLRFSFSFGDIESHLKSDFDNRVLLKKFDWGAHGLYMLYRIYQEGLYDSSKDPVKAQVFLKRSVDRDYNEAIFKMASFIVTSQNFLSIKEDKLEILKKAADLGNGDYQFAYASCLAERRDKFNDLVNAAHYFKLAMLSGHPNAGSCYERIQCNVFPATKVECNKIYAIAVSDKIDQLKVKLNMLKRTADCNFDPSIILYPTMLVDIDCSPLNPDRPMDREMQRKEVCHYFMCAVKKGMKWCHSVLSLFLLRNLKNVDDVNNALKILNEGSSFGLYDSSVFYARLLLRLLGRSYRQVDYAVTLLRQAASESYQPALLELSNSFLYGDEIGETYSADNRLAIESLRQLYQMKEPIGSSRFLYILINDKTVPKQLTNTRINELKMIVDSTFPEISKNKNLNVKRKRGTYDCLPLWLYAKVMLEGKVTSTDFKAAVTALKKADDFAPAMVLLVSLCFQFNGIVKPTFSIFNIPLFNSSVTNKPPSNSPAVPKNFDPSLLPLPSATNGIVDRFVGLADPTFMYKKGCMYLIEDENSERGFQLIRQSADAGSICGMMRYAMIRIEGSFRSTNEYEAIKMLRKSAQMGLDVAVLQYAHYAMKYKELCQEAIRSLQLIRGQDSTTAESSQNFVSHRKSCFVEGSKLRLALGKSLYFQGGSLLQESQFHLTSVIQQYENQTPQNEPTENNASSSSISKEEYAEALFYIGKLFEKSAVNFAPSDLCIKNSLIHFLRSYSNGCKEAAESYVSLLMRVGEFETAVDFLLDNLSCLTFSLYKIGSMTIYETPGVTTNIAESQAVDFIKLATLMDDVTQFPDAIWRYGTMLRDGFYVAKDEENALDCFYNAARLGCVNAIVAIGDFALKQSKKAFERSKRSQKSIEMLSIATQNKIVAAKCFENASRANSSTGSWCEALCLLHGIGREIDRPAAVLTLRKMADRGDRDAIYKLGKIAFNASKSGKNQVALFTIAVRLIVSAAQLGHSTALWRLGLLILQEKVQKNSAFNVLNNICDFDFLNASSEKVAAELFKRSAESGNCRAASLFSLCLENGIGVDRNIDLARLYASCNAKEKKS